MCIQYLIILTVRTLFLQVGGITDTLPISVFTQKFKARGLGCAVRSCGMTSSKSQATELYLFMLLSPVICF